MSETRKTAVLWALVAASLHTVFAVGASAIEHLFWGQPRWNTGRWLRVVDAPMAWAIEPTLQRFSIPPDWVDVDIARLLFTNVSLVHSAFGGLFWALMAALVGGFWRQRRAAVAPAPSPVLPSHDKDATPE
jgi:hypothetical protein